MVVTSGMMVRGKSLYRDNVMFSLGMMAEILVLSSYDAIGWSEQKSDLRDGKGNLASKGIREKEQVLENLWWPCRIS